mgnify:CR=1 FL=1
MRRATTRPPASRLQSRNFYPRSPCGERLPVIGQHAALRGFLSTLSLRRATAGRFRRSGGGGISIHALLAESDVLVDGDALRETNFYPRSPCGERLTAPGLDSIRDEFLSTLSLRRATEDVELENVSKQISIHALLAESDHLGGGLGRYPRISIHALLAESDRRSGWSKPRALNFYPRSPCGERQVVL